MSPYPAKINTLYLNKKKERERKKGGKKEGKKEEHLTMLDLQGSEALSLEKSLGNISELLLTISLPAVAGRRKSYDPLLQNKEEMTKEGQRVRS